MVTSVNLFVHLKVLFPFDTFTAAIECICNKSGHLLLETLNSYKKAGRWEMGGNCFF